jgi:hypothetical protein
MYKNKIVHIIILDKFIPPFIDFIDENFNANEHYFVILGKERYKFGLTKEHDVVWIDSVFKLLSLAVGLNKSRKIIIHGLWSQIFNAILFSQPWLLKKSYWVMWGGDFYFPQRHGWLQKWVIKNMGFLITANEGDYILSKKLYNSKGKRVHSIMYPSNLYKDFDAPTGKKRDSINIQLGNSADPQNNHLEMIEKLKHYKTENIKIYTPLSYGDKLYAKRVAMEGKRVFGEKFIPMMDFLPLDEYQMFLNSIDIAIFAHDRQQAMGNIITLLGLGKKVYLKSSITTWQLLIEQGMQVFDINDFDLTINTKQLSINTEQVVKYYSKEVLIAQITDIIEG